MGWTNVHPVFQNGSKKIISHRFRGLETQNPRSRGILTILAIFQILIFFQNREFFLLFRAENLIFYDINTSIPCVASYKLLWRSG